MCPGVVDRIADLVPGARMIYLVRDPVDRVVAEYAEQMQWGAVFESIDSALVDADDPRNWLVAGSRYATQLREYLRRFDSAQIKVVDLADLAADPLGTMVEVFDFLGLDRPELDADDFPMLNTRADKLAIPGWIFALRRGWFARAAHWVPKRPRKVVTQFAWRRLRTPVATPELDERTLAELRRVLQPEVDDLRTLTGQQFATWSL